MEVQNKIRSLTVRFPAKDREEKDIPLGRLAVYQTGTGTKHTVGYDGTTPIRKEISDIVFEDGSYYIYVSSNNESQLWKEIPKTEFVSVEYNID